MILRTFLYTGFLEEFTRNTEIYSFGKKTDINKINMKQS